MQPDLSIVILNYRMSGLLKNCLKSIFEHQTQKSFEVIVVDNDSDDGCEEIVTRHFPQVQFIQSGANYGHAIGNNIGINASQGRYIMILNPDTVFMEPLIDPVVDLLDFNRRIGITTVQLRNPDGSLQSGAWRFYKLFTPIFQRSAWLSQTKRGQSHINDFMMKDWGRQDSRDVDWVQGSCMVARREVLDELKGFDERFFLYFTDVDLCYRCWDAGWNVYYYADASIVHYFNRESARHLGLRSLTSRTTRIHIKDWLRYLHKYRGRTYPRNFTPQMKRQKYQGVGS